MKNSELRKIAKENLSEGKSKQETFEILKDASTLKAEELAKIVQSIPSEAAKNKYKVLNIILMALLGITVLIKMLAGLPLIIDKGIQWLPVLFIFPIINIIMLVGVALYWPGTHRFVGFISALSAVRLIGSKDFSFTEVYSLIDLTLVLSLIGLGLYLNHVLTPNYEILKEPYTNAQGQKRLRNVIKFID